MAKVEPWMVKAAKILWPSNWERIAQVIAEVYAEHAPGVAPQRTIDGKFSTDGAKIFNTVSGEEIPHDEPLFLLRGRDHNALVAIHAYQGACENECNGLHMAGIQQVREAFCQFAAYHPERMKQPGITRHLKLAAPKEGEKGK